MAFASAKSFIPSDVLKGAECCICNELFDDNEHVPKNLTCGHSLCVECIEKLERFHHETSQYVVCPLCVGRSELPERVQDLTTNFVALSLSTSCKKLFDRQSTPSTEEEAELCDCGELMTEENFNFCEVCSLAVCDRCAWKKHRNHDCHSAEIYIKDLMTRSEKMKKECQQTLESLEQDLKKTEDSAKFFSFQVKHATDAVERQFDDLMTCLKESKSMLITGSIAHESLRPRPLRPRIGHFAHVSEVTSPTSLSHFAHFHHIVFLCRRS